MAKGQLGALLAQAAGVAASDDSGGGQRAAMIAAMVNQMVQLRYGRKDESESDRYGIDAMDSSGYDPKAMLEVLKHGDAWVISILYIGTFGSFIGFGFAFGQVLNQTFLAGLTDGAAPTPAQSATAALQAAQIAFIGPLLGSLSRVWGGRLSDRRGGARVTLWTFVGLVVAGVLVTLSAYADDVTAGAASTGQLAGLIGGFVLLFVLSGIGNGSVYKMIPVLFEAKAATIPGPAIERTAWSRSMSGALIGIAGAIGALGGVLINLGLRASYQGPSHSARKGLGSRPPV